VDIVTEPVKVPPAVADVTSCAEKKSRFWVALADPDASTKQLLPAASE
jgi:hypothetical protein